MSTFYYVDAEDGSDSNTGLSLLDAWQTLTHAAATVPDSDFSLFCHGTFLENVTFTGKSDFLISGLNEEVPSEFQCNGYVVIDPGTVTNSGSGYYTFTPTGSVMIGQIANDYVTDKRFDAQPQCFIPRAANLAAAQSTPNSWWQDSTTKLVTVYPHASMDAPDDETADWCWFRTGNGLRLAGCSNGELRSCVLYGWVGGDTTTGLPSIDTGYGILVNTNATVDSNGIVVRDVTVIGFGGHAFGGVTGQYNVQFIGCHAQTGRQGIGATAYVFHSNSGNSASELSGDRWINCTATLDGLLDFDGAHISAGPLNGFYTHGGGGVRPLDVEGTGCTVNAVTGTECRFGFGAGATNATITDPKVYSQFPVRFTDCTLVDGHGQQMTLADPATDKYQIAYRRCYLETTRNGELTTETYLWNIEGTGTQVLFEACVLVGSDNDGDTAGMRVINVANTAHILMLNCLMYNTPSAAAMPMFYANATTILLTSYGSVFMHTSTNARLIGNADVPEANLAFGGNWYRGFTVSTGYNNGDASTSKSQAQWTANVDPTGVYTTDPQLTASDLGAIVPTAGGALRTTQAIAAPTYHTSVGFNDFLYSRHYGPWQYGLDPDTIVSGRTGASSRANRSIRA